MCISADLIETADTGDIHCVRSQIGVITSSSSSMIRHFCRSNSRYDTKPDLNALGISISHLQYFRNSTLKCRSLALRITTYTTTRATATSTSSCKSIVVMQVLT